MNYPVLSLSPPYGTLIAAGRKWIESRSWATTYRGPLLIHQTAAPGPKGTTEAALWDLCLSDSFRKALPQASPARLPRGKIIALVTLHDCRPTDEEAALHKRGWSGYVGDRLTYWDLTETERAFGNYSAGRWAWLLADVRPLPESIAARGMPGLWRWEGDLGL